MKGLSEVDLTALVRIAAIACAAAAMILLSRVPADAAENVLDSLFPRPKSVKVLRGVPLSFPAGKTAIVIGDKASEPEQYAAEALQKWVSYWHSQQWKIVKESSIPKDASALVVLGQQSTCRLALSASADWKVSFTAGRADYDAYAVRTGTRNGRAVALVLGSNPRSVIYGQDTLSQLMTSVSGTVSVPQIVIADQSSIKWRGRPHAGLNSYSNPGTFDFFAQCRVNFIDMRDGPAIYGTPPGHPLQKEKIRTFIREAHKRGIVVYGTVNCAVTEPQRPDVLKTFQEFIDLGVDGLWLSVDDPGGDDRIGTPFDLVRQAVELGKKHGMTGNMIAITPGKESYKAIRTDTNRKTMQIPGMNEALLFFTPLPSADLLQGGREVGLKSKPCWWHNWPRPRGGFIRQENFAYRTDNGLPYMALPAMSEGWDAPSWEELRNAGSYIDAVMPWGGSTWTDYMMAGVIDLWAWAPENHDWERHRSRLYALTYGPDRVEAARTFDDSLLDLEDMFFQTPEIVGKPAIENMDAWPPRLKDLTARTDARELINELRQALAELEKPRHRKTWIDVVSGTDTLQRRYLEPARKTIEAAAVVTELTYPEYWWRQQLERVQMAARMGNGALAARWQTEGEQRSIRQAEEVMAATPMLKGVDAYVQSWKERFRQPVRATFASKPPALKGDLSDPAWSNATPVTGFQLGSDAGTAEDQTEFRLLYTDDALYVGITCFESYMDGLLLERTSNGQDVWEDDSVEVFVNTDCFGLPYYQFVANANGITYDGNQGQAGAFDETWAPKWDVKTAKAVDRWTAEIRIPLSAIGVQGPLQGQLWLMNIIRNDHASRQKETVGDHWMQVSAWGYQPRGGNHDPRRFRPVSFE